MSFLRHEEIYRPMNSMPGWSRPDRPRSHRFDEFPAGYSLVGCAALPQCPPALHQPELIVKRAEVEVQSKTSEWQVVS
jgi:pterin-4a-carbinolamine dehydratase